MPSRLTHPSVRWPRTWRGVATAAPWCSSGGTAKTFDNCLRSVRAGGTVSSLGVYSGHLQIPLEAFAAGLGDHTIVTTLCPGGKERMRRLMSVVNAKRLPFRDLVTHTFSLDQIEEAYELFAHQRDGVMKIAIRP